MKGKWEIETSSESGITLYRVSRLRDAKLPDHPENREGFGDYIETKDEAEMRAEFLNEEWRD